MCSRKKGETGCDQRAEQRLDERVEAGPVEQTRTVGLPTWGQPLPLATWRGGSETLSAIWPVSAGQVISLA